MVKRSRLAWGVWVEITSNDIKTVLTKSHASHEACELKFNKFVLYRIYEYVTPRMRRVSWNLENIYYTFVKGVVTPRMRRVSWNFLLI